MLPPSAVSRAALRWLRLLRSSTVEQAWAILRTDPKYLDLTPTQYGSALDWLLEIGLIERQRGLLAPSHAATVGNQQPELLFERGMYRENPPWLQDADMLLEGSAELPNDAANFAEALGLRESVALAFVRQLQGKVDAARSAEIGLIGEKNLVNLLEYHWPGSTSHVSLTSDGFGYDVAFRPAQTEWHLEVKSTTRRGRLSIFVSRHEHEMALMDPQWRLIAVGLDSSLNIVTVGTIRHAALLSRAPRDQDALARWQSVRHEITPGDVEIGMPFLSPLFLAPIVVDATFDWAPSQEPAMSLS